MKVLTRIGYAGEKALIGVEYDCQSAEIILIRTQSHKGKLLIEESQVFQEGQKLQDYLLQWPALALVFRLKNSGAIEKWIPAETEDKIKQTLGVRVENSQDFIFEEIEGTSEKNLLNLIRKEVYQEALQILGVHKDRLIGLYLSEAATCFLLPAWSNYSENNPIRFVGAATYTWKRDLSEDTDYTETIHHEELAKELAIPPNELNLYASLLLGYLQGKQRISGIPALQYNRQQQTKFYKLSKGLSLSLALFLCLFIGVFSLQSWFSYQHRQSTEIISGQKTTLSRIQTYKTSLREKTDFLSSSQEKSLAPSKIAWYLDQFSALAPNELGFSRILYKGKSKQLKKIDIRLESRTFDLLILGESRNSHALTAFSLDLAERPWVQLAEIFDSQYDYREQHLQFILLVSLSDETLH